MQDKGRSIYSAVSRLPKSITEINSFFDKKEFVEKTRQQIEKDLSGLFLFNPKPERDVLGSFELELKLILNQLSSNQLKQFCYRVDLGETLVEDLLANSDEKAELAFQIIKREAQKVYLRTQFKA